MFLRGEFARSGVQPLAARLQVRCAKRTDYSGSSTAGEAPLARGAAGSIPAS